MKWAQQSEYAEIASWMDDNLFGNENLQKRLHPRAYILATPKLVGRRVRASASRQMDRQ